MWTMLFCLCVPIGLSTCMSRNVDVCSFFLQAEDGIRDGEGSDGADVGQGLRAGPGAAVGIPDAAGRAAASGVVTIRVHFFRSRAQRGVLSEPRTERGTSGVSGASAGAAFEQLSFIGAGYAASGASARTAYCARSSLRARL